MAWPNPDEIAVLTINGQEYRDWETVWVKHAYKEPPFYTFRFTCSEGMPLAQDWWGLRIRPGDFCKITLGGQPAFTGLVHTRQVFYDGRRHHIEIQGASQVLMLNYAHVTDQSMEVNNSDYLTYARRMLAGTGINITVEGGSLPNDKFDRLSNAHGVTIMEALELPLRALGPYVFSSNLQGDLVVIASSPTGGQDTVREGREILEGREIIYNPGIASGNFSVGQRPGGDQSSGAAVSHTPFNAGPTADLIPQAVKMVFPLEIPNWKNEFLSTRNQVDSYWQNEDWITVWITVQGWKRPSGGLWYRNQQVDVVSPMLIMRGNENLHAKSVTFTQDDQRGTRTVLELCNTQAMQGFVPQGPGAGT